LSIHGLITQSKFQVRALKLLTLKGQYLDEAGDNFVSEAVHFQSRDDFNEYMQELENKYYNSVNLPRSPYTSSLPHFGHEVASLPNWPPKPTTQNATMSKSIHFDLTLTLAVHNADEFIEQLLALNDKRRGRQNPSKAKLDLSGPS